MQPPSAAPDLSHTHTRPIHWVATATALAGVIALSALLQPDAATAAQPPASAAGPRSTPADTAPPDPAHVAFPLRCGPVEAVVRTKAAGDLDGDGRPETVVAVHCDAPTGTPPDAVYVLTRGPSAGTPRVVATLVGPEERRNVTALAVRDGAVLATLLGYSSADVPSCCPDVTDDAKWRWKGGAFVRSTPTQARPV
ncbi:hypothetical protein [Streptomyces sp. NPDC003717]|uniref:hypothetical protein n=1 Tax=Streptomyces sp. NPDC003717 TaxID=3154276 RepID=UPI0033B01779